MTDILYRGHRDSRLARFGRHLHRVPTGEVIDARDVIASTLALSALIAGATAGGAVASGAIQSRSATRGAQLQTQAANYAADQLAAANQREEQFKREQAQHDWENQETTRRANYDQWAARERRLGSIAERLGYGRRDIPGYVPSVNPGYLPPSGGVSTTQPVTNAQPGLTPTLTARDAILARRFPPGSVGAMVLDRRQRPAGAGA